MMPPAGTARMAPSATLTQALLLALGALALHHTTAAAAAAGGASPAERASPGVSSSLSRDGPAVTYSTMFACNDSFPYIHQAMLEVLPGGMVAGGLQAGAREGASDQIVLTVLSDDGGTTWGDAHPIAASLSGAQWGPILMYDTDIDVLWAWWAEGNSGEVLRGAKSVDRAGSWGAAFDAGDTISAHARGANIMFIMNKVVVLPPDVAAEADGKGDREGTGTGTGTGSARWVLPVDTVKPSTAFVAVAADGVATFTAAAPPSQQASVMTLEHSTFLEPAVAVVNGSTLLATLRATDGNAYAARSSDGGTSWSTPVPLLPAADSKTALWSFGGAASGLLLAYNNKPGSRGPLQLDVSWNGGGSFEPLATLEDGADGLAHCYPTPVTNGTHALTAYSVYNASYGAGPGRVGVRVAVTPLPEWVVETATTVRTPAAVDQSTAAHHSTEVGAPVTEAPGHEAAADDQDLPPLPSDQALQWQDCGLQADRWDLVLQAYAHNPDPIVYNATSTISKTWLYTAGGVGVATAPTITNLTEVVDVDRMLPDGTWQSFFSNTFDICDPSAHPGLCPWPAGEERSYVDNHPASQTAFYATFRARERYFVNGVWGGCATIVYHQVK